MGVPSNACLDRIDPTQGYVQGNVRLVCWQAKKMRAELTDEELIVFCKLIFQHNQDRHGQGQGLKGDRSC